MQRMALSNPSDLEKFLDTLGGSVHPDGSRMLNGQIFLVNLRNSCREKLVKRDYVIEFLSDCAGRLGDGTLVDALKIVEVVSNAMDPATPDAQRYLRHCKHDSFQSGSMLSTVTTYTSFMRYQYEPDPKVVGPELLEAVGPTTEEGMQKLAAEIWRITSLAGWHKVDATLGPPPTGNCWVSSDGFKETRADAVHHAAATPADIARDELGLVYDTQTEHLVKFSFSADTCVSAASGDIGRPTFADNGNTRFRAGRSCPRSEEMAASGWGCTVHLGRLPDVTLHPPSGRAERVARSMRLADLHGFQVTYLLATRLARGGTPEDDDDAFLDMLRDVDTIESIKAQIMNYLQGHEI